MCSWKEFSFVVMVALISSSSWLREGAGCSSDVISESIVAAVLSIEGKS